MNKKMVSIACAYGMNEPQKNRILDFIWQYEDGTIGNYLICEFTADQDSGTRHHVKYGCDTKDILARFNRQMQRQGWSLRVEFTMMDRVVFSYIKPAPEKEFPVLTLTRADIRGIGYDPSRLDDKEFAALAWKVGESEPMMDQYWDSVEVACENAELPRILLRCVNCSEVFSPVLSDRESLTECPYCGHPIEEESGNV